MTRTLAPLLLCVWLLTACDVFLGPRVVAPPTALPVPTLTLQPAPADTAPAGPTASPAASASPSAIILPTPAPTLAPGPAQPPDPSAYTLKLITSGLVRPVFLTHAGDASGRLFVLEQPGRIRIIQSGALLPEPFLDLESVVGSESNEQGLLGLAFHPDYGTGGSGTGGSQTRPYFFVNYTDENGDTVIARFNVSGADPNRADPASGLALFHIAQPYPNHNGGDLAFGPDGYLYIALGDGGAAGDPQGNAQNLNTLLGKILRVDVNQPAYTLPPDNPFASRADARAEIWAYGLRNPWRISFDRATGDLWIGDVGENAYEEIDFQPAGSLGGENYGWDFLEGKHAYEGNAPAILTEPVAEYSHAEGGCAVTGGYVYRGSALPVLKGIYFFGDYCSSQLWAFYPASPGWVMDKMFQAGFRISSFGEDEAGELYLLDHGGAVYQLVARP